MPLLRRRIEVAIKFDEQFLHLLSLLISKGDRLMALIDDLRAEVERNTTVDQSVIALVTALAAKIQALIDAGSDPAALQAFVDQLKASNDAVAAAVTANTPAAPNP